MGSAAWACAAATQPACCCCCGGGTASRWSSCGWRRCVCARCSPSAGRTAAISPPLGSSRRCWRQVGSTRMAHTAEEARRSGWCSRGDRQLSAMILNLAGGALLLGIPHAPVALCELPAVLPHHACHHCHHHEHSAAAAAAALHPPMYPHTHTHTHTSQPVLCCAVLCRHKQLAIFFCSFDMVSAGLPARVRMYVLHSVLHTSARAAIAALVVMMIMLL